jgi:hypothetical protein
MNGIRFGSSVVLHITLAQLTLLGSHPLSLTHTHTYTNQDLVVRARVCATGEYPPCER